MVSILVSWYSHHTRFLPISFIKILPGLQPMSISTPWPRVLLCWLKSRSVSCVIEELTARRCTEPLAHTLPWLLCCYVNCLSSLQVWVLPLPWKSRLINGLKIEMDITFLICGKGIFGRLWKCVIFPQLTNSLPLINKVTWQCGGETLMALNLYIPLLHCCCIFTWQCLALNARQ